MPKFQHIGTRKRPDYCLFTNPETLSSAAQGSDLDLYRATSTVLEAKRCQHNLDDVSRNETKGWFPSQQIQDYLAYARDASGKRIFFQISAYRRSRDLSVTGEFRCEFFGSCLHGGYLESAAAQQEILA